MWLRTFDLFVDRAAHDCLGKFFARTSVQLKDLRVWLPPIRVKERGRLPVACAVCYMSRLVVSFSLNSKDKIPC